MYELRRFANAEELARAAAEEWLIDLSAGEGDYYAALSGGRIARNFCRAVAALVKPGNGSLQRVHFFWADERCVPPSHAESNYRLATEELLQPAGISAERIHRIRGEEGPPLAARQAEVEMKRIVPLNAEGWPVLDMIFLGMGEDGHVASLFPLLKLPLERAVFVPVKAPKPPPDRVSITFEVIAASKAVCVLASGEGKLVALQQSIQANGNTPLAGVIRRRQSTKVLTDIRL